MIPLVFTLLFDEGDAGAAPSTAAPAEEIAPAEILPAPAAPIPIEAKPVVPPPPDFMRNKRRMTDADLEDKRDHGYVTGLPLVNSDPDGTRARNCSTAPHGGS